jgi:hypothetical protein
MYFITAESMKFVRMKTSILVVLVICTAAYASAQRCDTYYPLSSGTVYELETFNPKQKKTGRMVNTVQDVQASGAKTEAKVLNEYYDEKDKKQTESAYTFVCDGDKVLIDMRSFVSPQMMEAYKDMEAKMEGDYLIIPAKLSVGEVLPEGNMTILLSDKKSGQQMTAIKVRIYNRTVEGKESITSPAGTFDCYKINYDMRMETSTMGIGIPVNMKVTEWLAPGTGVIKSENFNRNGKSVGYTLLTKLSK